MDEAFETVAWVWNEKKEETESVVLTFDDTDADEVSVCINGKQFFWMRLTDLIAVGVKLRGKRTGD